jgi:hypothetical protein
MLRCTLRYSASFPRNFAPYDRALKLRQQYGLENGAKSSALQPERIQVLREAFHTAQPVQRPEIAARAMAEDGYSPATVLAAVTLTGADFYLMAEPVPQADFDAISREVAPMHIGTSTNALRDGLKYMSPRTQALAAIQGGSILERGPSVLNKDFEFVPFEPRRPYPYPDDIVRLAKHSPPELLPILRQALHDHDYHTSTAAVWNYADQQGDPDVLIALLIEVACTDDGTLMHSVKHLNSMVEEFTSSTHRDRWNYLIAATRFMTWYAGLNTGAYQRAAQWVSA